MRLKFWSAHITELDKRRLNWRALMSRPRENSRKNLKKFSTYAIFNGLKAWKTVFKNGFGGKFFRIYLFISIYLYLFINSFYYFLLLKNYFLLLKKTCQNNWKKFILQKKTFLSDFANSIKMLATVVCRPLSAIQLIEELSPWDTWALKVISLVKSDW